MQFYKFYEQKDKNEISDLIQSQSTCLLTTVSTQSEIQCGVFNPVVLNEHFYLHLNRRDKQTQALRSQNTAKLIFQDILAVIPSHWIDEKDAGVATTYYRYVEFDCTIKLMESPEEMVLILERLMNKYQPEGKYEPLNHKSATYVKSLDMISIAEFAVSSFQAKWKIGQNRPVEKRRAIIECLKKRNQGNDARAALEIQKWIEAH